MKKAKLPAEFEFGFEIRPALRLRRVEELLNKSKLIQPPPSRRDLINLLHSKVLEGKLTRFGWIVFEDSFLKWMKSFQE